MKTQNSVGCNLLEVSFLKKEKPDFLLPSPLVWVLVLVREVMYLPVQLRHTETFWFCGYLWGPPGDCYCFLLSTVFRSLRFLIAILCVAGRDRVQNRWTWILMNSHFAESYAQISSLHICALGPLSWGDPVQHQFFDSFAASEILKLCLLVVCFLIGILVFLSSWWTLQLLKLLLTWLGINVYVLNAFCFIFNCLLKLVRQAERGVCFASPFLLSWVSTTGLSLCDWFS